MTGVQTCALPILDKESLTELYLEQYVKANASNNSNVARSCLDSLARLYGLNISRIEHGSAGDFDKLSDEQLIEIISAPLNIEEGITESISDKLEESFDTDDVSR